MARLTFASFFLSLLGKFDIYFSSHQLWHILIALSMAWWYYFCLDVAYHRHASPCQISS